MLSWAFEDKALENLDIQTNNTNICGIDEVGRGCLAGPVVACAAVFKSRGLDFLLDINDSKKLSKKQRESLFPKLQQNTLYAIGSCCNLEVDNLNIYHASLLAMKRAYHNLCKICNVSAALIDGNKSLDIPINNYAIVKGDGISFSIAAASILAKVYRDRLMSTLSKLGNNSCYGWERNAGYATKIHKEAIENFGITKYHRKSFAPVKAFS